MGIFKEDRKSIGTYTNQNGSAIKVYLDHQEKVRFQGHQTSEIIGGQLVETDEFGNQVHLIYEFGSPRFAKVNGQQFPFRELPE